MRPLVIIFLQLGIGGVQRKIVDIVNFIGKHEPNLPIYILLRNRTAFDLTEEIRNKNVRIINYEQWVKAKIPFRVRLFFPFFVLYQVWSLNPNSILAFLDFCSLPAIWAKKLFFWRKFRVVLSEDHYASGVNAVEPWSRFRHFLVKIFYPFADMIFTCSEANKRDLIESYNLPEKKIKIIPNWTTFKSQKNKDSKKICDLIYVGRLEKTKNLKFLLLAIRKIKLKKRKIITLCLLGEGREKENLEKLVSKLKLEKQVSFVSTTHDVEKFLAGAKIFVYCSWFKVEGLPLAILEAMALGIPVLTRNFAGAEEFLLDKENCYLFKKEEEFIQKVVWLLNHNKERGLVSARAKEYVTRYHSPQNILIYLEQLGY